MNRRSFETAFSGKNLTLGLLQDVAALLSLALALTVLMHGAEIVAGLILMGRAV